jgi:hypothetical protein
MLRYFLSVLIAVCVLVTIASGQPQPLPKVIAEGEWSKPTDNGIGNALRGRLMLCEKVRTDYVREVVVFLEFHNASIGDLAIYCEFTKPDRRPEFKGGLNCELRDKDGQLIKPTGYPFGGGAPQSRWVVLPRDSTIRLRTSPFGVWRANALGITPYLDALWTIPKDDPNEYLFSGTFTVQPKEDGIEKDGGRIWRGVLELPAVRIKY